MAWEGEPVPGEWRLLQDGIVVASGDGIEHGRHYAMVYNEDGPVHLEEWTGAEWATVLRATKGALAETARRLARRANSARPDPEPQP